MIAVSNIEYGRGCYRHMLLGSPFKKRLVAQLPGVQMAGWQPPTVGPFKVCLSLPVRDTVSEQPLATD